MEQSVEGVGEIPFVLRLMVNTSKLNFIETVNVVIKLMVLP
jgi:hypothetical protein